MINGMAEVIDDSFPDISMFTLWPDDDDLPDDRNIKDRPAILIAFLEKLRPNYDQFIKDYNAFTPGTKEPDAKYTRVAPRIHEEDYTKYLKFLISRRKQLDEESIIHPEGLYLTYLYAFHGAGPAHARMLLNPTRWQRAKAFLRNPRDPVVLYDTGFIDKQIDVLKKLADDYINNPLMELDAKLEEHPPTSDEALHVDLMAATRAALLYIVRALQRGFNELNEEMTKNKSIFSEYPIRLDDYSLLFVDLLSILDSIEPKTLREVFGSAPAADKHEFALGFVHLALVYEALEGPATDATTGPEKDIRKDWAELADKQYYDVLSMLETPPETKPKITESFYALLRNPHVKYNGYRDSLAQARAYDFAPQLDSGDKYDAFMRIVDIYYRAATVGTAAVLGADTDLLGAMKRVLEPTGGAAELAAAMREALTVDLEDLPAGGVYAIPQGARLRVDLQKVASGNEVKRVKFENVPGYDDEIVIRNDTGELMSRPVGEVMLDNVGQSVTFNGGRKVSISGTNAGVEAVVEVIKHLIANTGFSFNSPPKTPVAALAMRVLHYLSFSDERRGMAKTDLVNLCTYIRGYVDKSAGEAVLKLLDHPELAGYADVRDKELADAASIDASAYAERMMGDVRGEPPRSAYEETKEARTRGPPKGPGALHRAAELMESMTSDAKRYVAESALMNREVGDSAACAPDGTEPTLLQMSVRAAIDNADRYLSKQYQMFGMWGLFNLMLVGVLFFLLYRIWTLLFQYYQFRRAAAKSVGTPNSNNIFDPADDDDAYQPDAADEAKRRVPSGAAIRSRLRRFSREGGMDLASAIDSRNDRYEKRGADEGEDDE